jgi:outer membrane protein TolC
MTNVWRHWWVGVCLSCGCVATPESPDSHVEARGQSPSGWQKIEPVGFHEQVGANPPEVLPIPKQPTDLLAAGGASGLQVPELKPLPINLATALRLMNVRSWDIAIAAEGVRAASAVLEGANALWLPTLIAGVDYQHHDGPIQNTDGSTTNTSRSGLMVGGAPSAVFSISDAIFEPLWARQVDQARRQQLQAATNDTTRDVAIAYFDVQEARGALGGARDTIRRTREMLKTIESMAPQLVPTVEVSRARAQLSRFEQNEQSASERWNISSANLVRILRMNPATVVEPIERPEIQITLIPPAEPIENMLSLALASRPELAATRALSQAAEDRWREERFRPLLPVILARGNATQLPDSFAFGGYASGHGGSLSGFNLRDDFEVQAVWELKNLGFGNQALIRGRRAEYEASRMQAFRAQDIVAQEVVQAAAQARSAAARASQAERELREAIQSADENYQGMKEVKRVGGNIVINVIRPQEALASAQALLQAYFDYYGTVADFNRAEFQLYRALGNPAQSLVDPTGATLNCCRGVQRPMVTPQQPPPLQGPDCPAIMPQQAVPMQLPAPANLNK